MYTLYGISSCSTVTKARRFLEENNCGYQFYDLKKQPVTIKLISELEARVGWERMLNKRSTTWRQLDESQKEGVDQHKAIALMVEKPTLIKRPLLDTGKNILLGFKIEAYQQVL